MLYFEDLRPGQTFELGPYRVTREAIISFATAFDPQPFHLDEALAARSMAGGLCASGWHTCAILMRMWYDGWLKDTASMGAPSVDEVKWLRPVRPDDVLSGVSEILSMRVSQSRPEMGLVACRHTVRNAAGETVAELRHPFMIAVRSVGASVGGKGGAAA